MTHSSADLPAIDVTAEITALRARVVELTRERENLVAMVDILQGVSGATQYPEILQVVAARLGESFDLDRCSVFLFGEQPVFVTKFYLPTNQDIDRRLIVGAALFGIGWGMVGLCPGPAITSLVSGSGDALVFFVSMITGMYVYGTLEVIGSTEADGGVSGIDYLLGLKRS